MCTTRGEWELSANGSRTVTTDRTSRAGTVQPITLGLLRYSECTGTIYGICTVYCTMAIVRTTVLYCTVYSSVCLLVHVQDLSACPSFVNLVLGPKGCFFPDFIHFSNVLVGHFASVKTFFLRVRPYEILGELDRDEIDKTGSNTLHNKVSGRGFTWVINIIILTDVTRIYRYDVKSFYSILNHSHTVIS